MTESTEIVIPPSEQELIQATQSEFGDDQDLVIPYLKVCQPLTKEVGENGIQAGDIINALTGENFGRSVEFVVGGFHKGRFQADDNTNKNLCVDPNVSPSGVPYPDDPDAEEQFRAAVQRGEKVWGKGPPISTTYNFVGFASGSEMPVKLSMMRAATKVAQKWLTMLRFSRAPWDTVYTLGTVQTQNKGGQKFWLPTVTQAGKTTAEQRQSAVNLAQALQVKSVEYAEEDVSEAQPKPADTGGLDI
jgi:hypothetical protein